MEPLGPVRVAARAVLLEGDRILLTVNRDRDGPFYLCPGGGQLFGETLRDALVRECREEIGAEVEVGRLLFVRDYIGAHHDFAEEDDVHQVEIFFSCRVRSRGIRGEGASPDPWQTGSAWVSVADLSSLRFYPAALVKPLRALAEGGEAPACYLGDVN